MHTERIRNAYKHIKGRKERRILLYFFLYCLSFPSSTARVYRQSNFLFASSGMYGYHRAIQITHQASLPVLLGRGRSQFMTNHLAHELYALYALKNRLCILCENTTPKKTAYNAYKNENRRVRRAEGTKMYAYGNAYGTHTKCIQAYKRVKREESLLLLPFILSDLHSLLFAFPGNLFFSTVCVFRHSRTPFSTARFCRRSSTNVSRTMGVFRAFFARLTGYPPLFRPFLPHGHRTFLRACTHFRPFRRLRCLDG